MTTWERSKTGFTSNVRPPTNLSSLPLFSLQRRQGDGVDTEEGGVEEEEEGMV